MTAAPSRPLRCHLLIGPPASGKTTLAGVLAELTGAVVLSTDELRSELFGDPAVQGPWRDIEVLLHQRIRESVAAAVPVIVDATHARRPWRLAIIQALILPAPVEWIGWWLHTPLGTCLQWNQTRQRLVPEPVIREMAAALTDPVFGPSRAEGFAAVVALVPTHQRELAPLLRGELARLDHALALKRSELLLHHSGGIYFGDNLEEQVPLASPNARLRARQLETCASAARAASLPGGTGSAALAVDPAADSAAEPAV